MNVVGTVLLTSLDNPMCPGCDNYPPNPDLLREWVKSLRDCYGFVFHDQLDPEDFDEGLALITSCTLLDIYVEPTDENLFFQRWRIYQRWLAAVTEVEYVWFTDGTDVRMLNEPWPHMRPDTLYVGSEEDVVANKWIVDHHPSIRPFVKHSPKRQLMNAGLCGGDRATVLRFLDHLIAAFDNGLHDQDMTDMAAFNLVLYEDWDGYTLTGLPVHTRFGAKAKSHREAWFAHK